MASKILLGPSSFAEIDKAPLARLLEAGYEVVDNPYKRKLTKAELFDLLDLGVIGIIAGLEPLDREVLTRSKLKVVSRVGSGISNVDLKAAEELGIAVCSTPNGPTEAVAELTIGALLGLLRMIPQMDRALHDGRWDKRIGTQLAGKTVALIGYGRIGRRVAELLAPFRVRILVVDPFLEQAGLAGIELMPLDEALPLADIVTLHSSGETCLLGPREFGLIKQGAFLLNVARGGLVAEEALVAALDCGRITGAWFDTFGTEPYSGALCGRTDVVLTPHVGSYTVECRQEMENEAVDNLLAALGKYN
jgi:D-3-phosphoglycerate dehydrogenase / 2-oxoglutarate reductase